jgi:hypothetical protein
MLDRKKLKKKILFGHFSSPFTLVPFIAGMSLLMFSMTVARKAGISMFGGISCMLGACGAFFTQLLLGGEKIRRNALEELQKESQQEKEKALNALDKHLEADGDPRTESYLRDLRILSALFNEKREWSGKADIKVAFDVASGVEKLFRECVRSLERTLELLRLANQVGTKKLRKNFLDRREEIVNDVGRSIDEFSRILDRLHTIGSDGELNSNLANISKELDLSLDIAREVDNRMKVLENSVLKYSRDFSGDTDMDKGK